MQEPSKILLFTVMISLGGFSCGVSDFNYRSITDQDISSVLAEWKRRDLSAQKVEVVVKEEGSGFMLIKHTINGSVHFGAIMLPKSKELADLPVMVILDGLNQENPPMRLDSYPKSGYAKLNPYADFIKIIPSFRGRTLYYKGVSYHSDGDFCDAYDGATDDAISLINAAESLFPQANYERIFATGYSRGGNVALLMGVRDPRINTIHSSAAPTDFYAKSVKENYGTQYQCQFFEGKTNSEARMRMLASSPVYFKPQNSLESVDIHHGQKDEVVPIWNAKTMSDHLSKYDIKLNVSIYPEGEHDIFTDPSATTEKSRAGLYMFMKSFGE